MPNTRVPAAAEGLPKINRRKLISEVASGAGVDAQLPGTAAADADAEQAAELPTETIRRLGHELSEALSRDPHAPHMLMIFRAAENDYPVVAVLDQDYANASREIAESLQQRRIEKPEARAERLAKELALALDEVWGGRFCAEVYPASALPPLSGGTFFDAGMRAQQWQQFRHADSHLAIVRNLQAPGRARYHLKRLRGALSELRPGNWQVDGLDDCQDKPDAVTLTWSEARP